MDDCRLACARQGQTECIRLNIGIAVAVPAYPASCTEKTGWAIAKLAFPAGIKRAKNRQENFPQIGHRILHFVCDEKPVPSERARTHEDRELAVKGNRDSSVEGQGV